MSVRIFLAAALLVTSFSSGYARYYSDAEVKAMFRYAPVPHYPLRCRLDREEGSGVFRLYVNEAGKVTAIGVLESTGHKELDQAALETFVQWRATSGKKREVDVPVTYTMSRHHSRR